jgi:SAM-dependent methyltransferase
MRKSMDLFGEALQAYKKGERAKFCFIVNNKHLSEHDLSRYFRKSAKLSKIENKMVSLCFGKILDVGCGTANYFPKLMKRGDILGIDISPKIIAIAKKNGFNCVSGDILKFESATKYDTITLFENNIGMAGSVSKTKLLLKRFMSLLSQDGQILLILRNAKDKNYALNKLQPVWKNKKGETFIWIIYNHKYLKKVCSYMGLNAEILMIEDNNYLIRIKR